MKKRSSHALVLGFLERISSGAFEEFPRQITELIGKQHGIYALYKGDRLYYVGLATNLRNRIKHHLKDRHAGKWDRFSLYLVHKVDHIKELESLLLRISDPKGNRAGGRLRKAENLSSSLQKKIKEAQTRQMLKIIGERTTSVKARAYKARKVGRRGTGPTLAPYVTSRFAITRTYKGKNYKASVLADGTIMMGSKTFNSPSMAGRAVTGLACDGWYFWKIKDAEGNWVPLDVLRKKKV